MSTRESTAKTAVARTHIEKATREGTCGKHRKAAVHYVKAAELFEDTGHTKEAAKAWLRAHEHAKQRSQQINRRPTFDA